MPSFPFFKQLDAMDCGPTCLRMIAKFYGKSYSLQTLRERSYITRQGVSLLGISDAAESIGFRSIGARLSWEQLKKEVSLPCIVHWKQRHFIVVYKIKKDIVYAADPAHGLIRYSKEEFLDKWISTKKTENEQGLCLILEPQPDFYSNEDEKIKKSSFKFLFSYLKPHRKFVNQLVIGMLLGSVLLLIFPFLTQAVVDIGINTENIGFVYLVLIAQMVLFIARASVDFIRSWILLHISSRINISLISDFLIKLMKLPIAFFNTKMTGDLLQRIGDHSRIESFLTTSTLNIIFSVFNLIVFGLVLAFYHVKILIVFIIGSVLYALWINVFMKRRRELDHKRFAQMSENQSSIIQLITGMQEIKLTNSEKQKRWEWERIQAKLFRVKVRSLSLDQYQQVGSVFINEIKNILISFLAAKAVIDGNISLGVMFAIQYIIGQMNSPIDQMITFIHSTQDAKISLERLGEIHDKKDEESVDENKLTILPDKKEYNIRNLDFQYDGPHSEMVLKQINLEIQQEKITAIVGPSGSGKTTLIKLMLGFYTPTNGELCIGDTQLMNYSNSFIRENCGAVMQDGFIFSDSIANNIAVGDEFPDRKKLLNAVKVANIQKFIESLPLSYNTRIGANGHGLSQGQQQRILIARAVYKNPVFLFFDEATNALDAHNEKIIMNNLNEFFKGKTVVIVAHRLSTVMNADQIVVIEKGELTEKGSHEELTKKKGSYFKLVKNQLELGN